MGNTVIKFLRKTTRCEGALLHTYEPGEELVLPARLAQSYISRGRAEMVRECQAHLLPPETKVRVSRRRSSRGGPRLTEES